ncbi:MAG: AbrB/MazE/SpoVT family DNA-binding domain-containing protein [Holophaga sp.]|nr:AbrB/MazE/SpoVT family DNA-binding domain-containing protein [Holophaga sp.]
MTLSQLVNLSTKGQLVLPRAIRTSAGLHPGSALAVTLESDGTITVRPVRGKLDAFFHSLDGVVPAGTSAIDAAIMESVEGLDDAARQR